MQWLWEQTSMDLKPGRTGSMNGEMEQIWEAFHQAGMTQEAAGKPAVSKCGTCIKGNTLNFSKESLVIRDRICYNRKD